MSLGNFSISLAVKDLDRSLEFYKTVGFTYWGGDPAHGWAILRCGSATIGLFKGMFEHNMMTFNPGWSDDAKPLAEFEDVRDVQARLKAAGIEMAVGTDPEGKGPAHIVFVDPDGNRIMLDQHVPRAGG